MMALEQKYPGYRLIDLLEGFVPENDIPDISVDGLSNDSREVKEGDLFIAYNGHDKNGTDYISHAIDSGAAAVLVDSVSTEYQHTQNVPTLKCEDLKERLGILASRFFSHPSEKLNLIGVTGTNGKTSVAYCISETLSHLNKKVGVIGTLGYGMSDNTRPSKNTTPDAIVIQKQLNEFVEKGAETAVLEVSSHGLEQYRLNGTHLDSAVFTNLSEEHLDYHNDMETYANAKRKLFQIETLSNAVINIDDDFGLTLYNSLKHNINTVPYAVVEDIDDGDDQTVCAKIVSSTIGHMEILVHSPWGEGVLVTDLYGRFNAYNLLAALSCLCLSGLSFDDAMAGLSAITGVPGRLQTIRSDDSPVVVVDYAHTPDALHKVLTELNHIKESNLICVLGCGGNRDKDKRSLMGRVAATCADIAVFTSDNPRYEAPELIIDDIVKGVDDPSNIIIDVDRESAIKQAISLSDKNDIVLIAGKGHETYQEIEGRRYPFNDARLIRNILGCAS